MKSRHAKVLVALISLLASGIHPDAFAQVFSEQDQDARPSIAPMLERVMPAVVNISVTGKAAPHSNPLFADPLFRYFFDLPDHMPDFPVQTVGSGVIVDAREGFVLTNYHVVANADEVIVTLHDGRRYDADLVGRDHGTDIAVLQIKGIDLTEISFGDSDSLRVGDFVAAIGNPFGLGQTATVGIISALGRTGLNIEGYESFIQTDASINLGNSGGALVDYHGDLIGINTAIISPAGGNIGIGFAVPSNMARAIMIQLIQFGKVQRGRLGVNIQDITPELSQALNLKTDVGVLITQIEPNSAAERAGLKIGDIIVGLNNHPTLSANEVRNSIALMRVGDQIELSIYRDGKRRVVKAVIGAALEPEISVGDITPALSGAEFANMDPGHQLYAESRGVIVSNVDQGSHAWRNGLRSNDVILAVNRQRVMSVDDLSKILSGKSNTIALDIMRGGSRFFIIVQ